MRLATFAVVVLFGCGDECSGCGPESIHVLAKTIVDVGLPDAGPPDAGPPDGGPPDTGPPEPGPAPSAACIEAAEALSAELYADEGACTVVVRLAYETREIIGHQVLCGPRQQVSEETARATGEADTGFDGRRSLHPASPEDVFVFVHPPSDFGGVAVVHARTGLTDFGGGIVWSGRGEITHPTSWRDPAALQHEECATDFRVPARGYDLLALSALEEAQVEAALEVVRHTAIGAAFARGGTLYDAVVLRYPRRVGVFAPSRAEWIVLLHGGQGD